MRMDENVNPEWKRQCQGSASGRKALQENERLTARVDGRILENDSLRALNRAQAERITKLESALNAATSTDNIRRKNERIAQLEALIADYPLTNNRPTDLAIEIGVWKRRAKQALKGDDDE